MPSSKPRRAGGTAPVATLTWDNVRAWRMARQHLRQRAAAEADRLARYLGATLSLTFPPAA